MLKNRILLTVWLLVAACLHIFGNDFGTRVILVASIIVPIVLVALALSALGKVNLKICLPNMLLSAESATIDISMKNSWPIRISRCKLSWKNMLTGETGHENLEHISETYTQTYKKENCGLYRFSVTDIMATDILGLANWTITQPMMKDEAEMLIMPKSFDIPVEILPGETIHAEAQDYSHERPGSDTSETFAIREYMPGDPIKSIHWKISQKTDKLMVREYGLPVTSNILILMETSQNADPSHINQLATNVLNISNKLVSMNQSHNIGWLDTATGHYTSHEIATKFDTDTAFRALAANTVMDIGTKAIDALGTKIHEFSHVFMEA